MPEDQVLEQPQPSTTPGTEIINPGANLFSESAWSTEAPNNATTQTNEPVVQPEVSNDSVPEEDIVDELEYLEKQTGFKSWDDIKNLKSQYEELQQKAQTPAEIKFANDESKRLFDAWTAGKEDEVLNFFDNKRKLSKAADMPAADAIKLHLQQTNPHYKPEDVEDIFDERYSVPRKPVQQMGEEDESFEDRMTEYTTRVAKVQRAIERDSVTAKQELAKRITELVPPEIPQPKPEQQVADPKVLENLENVRKGFIQKMESEYGSFDGFNTKVKDESVELPINFKIDEKDDAEIKQIMQKAVFDKLDVNDYFTERWFAKDQSGALIPNIQKMKADFYLLEKTEKLLQGIANKGATERRLHLMKANSNINVSGKTAVQSATPPPKEGQAAQIDYLWKNA